MGFSLQGVRTRQRVANVLGQPAEAGMGTAGQTGRVTSEGLGDVSQMDWQPVEMLEQVRGVP
jgi:hypothetical protein